MSNEYVSREIMDYYQRNRQSNDQFKNKQTLRQALESFLKTAYPEHGKFYFVLFLSYLR